MGNIAYANGASGQTVWWGYSTNRNTDMLRAVLSNRMQATTSGFAGNLNGLTAANIKNGQPLYLWLFDRRAYENRKEISINALKMIPGSPPANSNGSYVNKTNFTPYYFDMCKQYAGINSFNAIDKFGNYVPNGKNYSKGPYKVFRITLNSNFT
jgi:hypothetical protein